MCPKTTDTAEFVKTSRDISPTELSDKRALRPFLLDLNIAKVIPPDATGLDYPSQLMEPLSSPPGEPSVEQVAASSVYGSHPDFAALDPVYPLNSDLASQNGIDRLGHTGRGTEQKVGSALPSTGNPLPNDHHDSAPVDHHEPSSTQLAGKKRKLSLPEPDEEDRKSKRISHDFNRNTTYLDAIWPGISQTRARQ